jgi:hypothetical protein
MDYHDQFRRAATSLTVSARLWPARQSWIGDDFLIGGYFISAQNSPETRLADEDETPLPPGPERLHRWAQAEHRVHKP